MESHGGNVELVGVDDGVARIRLEGSCEGCPASASTLELAIKQALEEAAPDLDGLEVEGGPSDAGSPAERDRAPIASCRSIKVAPRRRRPTPGPPSWFDARRVGGARRGRADAAPTVAGNELVVARVEGTLLAYRDACADCGADAPDGELTGGVLACPAASAVTTCRVPAARWTTSGCCWSRCRCCGDAGAGWRWRHERVDGRDGRAAGASWSRRCRPLATSLRRRRRPTDRRPPARRTTRAGERALRHLRHAIPPDHRHLLQLEERRILCVCESCLALRAGRGSTARSAPARVAGRLRLPDELWASFPIPIGLAFFLRSTRNGGVVALYPSPAGATESELDLEGWEELGANPVLDGLEPDAEALVVDRMAEPPSTRSRRSTSATGWSG